MTITEEIKDRLNRWDELTDEEREDLQSVARLMGIDTGEDAPSKKQKQQSQGAKNPWFNGEVFNEDEAKKQAEIWAKKLKDLH